MPPHCDDAGSKVYLHLRFIYTACTEVSEKIVVMVQQKSCRGFCVVCSLAHHLHTIVIEFIGSYYMLFIVSASFKNYLVLIKSKHYKKQFVAFIR